MTIDQLFEILKIKIFDHMLVIDTELAGGLYKKLLLLIGMDKLQISDCELLMLNGALEIRGFVSMDGAVTFPNGSVILTTHKDTDGNFISDVCVNVSETGSFEDFFGSLAPFVSYDLKQEESLFSDFFMINPVFELDDAHFVIQIRSVAALLADAKRWMPYRGFIKERMLIEGKLVPGELLYPILTICFSASQTVSLPIGSGNGRIEIRTVDDFTLYELQQTTKACIVWDIFVNELNKNIIFRTPLFSGREERKFTAVLNPPLSVTDVTWVLKDIMMLPENMMLIPQEAFLSSFGLQQIDVVYGTEQQKKLPDMKYIRAEFAIARPVELFIPQIKLNDFQAAWESSVSSGNVPAVSLFLAADAALDLGDFGLKGDVTAYFPYMEFTGSLCLERQISVQELAKSCGMPLPDMWENDSSNEVSANVIASMDVIADAVHRSLRVAASVTNVLRLDINDRLAFELENISVEIDYSAENRMFSIAGVLSFDSFAFVLSAFYVEHNWKFSGTLARGQVDLVLLIKSVLDMNVEDTKAGVALQDFLVSYDTGKKELLIYASCEVWFSILGIVPSLGGRIRLQRTGEEKNAQLTAYLKIEEWRLTILAQVDDIYALEKRYIFRVELGKSYLQAVYTNKSGHEILAVDLGNVTLGDVALALVRLINPNAGHTLAPPWDILNRIRLDFVLTADLTEKRITMLYPLRLDLAGIFSIENVGLSYTYDAAGSGEKRKIEYILTGSCPGHEYTMEDPLSWDAMNGAPPENVAVDEKNFQLYYMCTGNHLDVDIVGNTLRDMLADVKSKIRARSGAADFSYRENAGWLIAADLKLSNIFRVGILLYDPEVYGVAVKLDLAKESEDSPIKFLDGLSLELYYKKISNETGMFHCRLTLPKKYSRLDLGAFILYLGEILLEVYTNGSFYIDLGFPHNRDFSKSWGVAVGTFSGRGGVYFGIFHGDAVNSVPAVTNGTFAPVVKTGVGLSIGLERSFDFGIVSGGISLVASGMFEGVFAVFQPNADGQDKAFYYKASATVGVVGSLFISVDFRIIVISASACVSAFCTLELESCRRALLVLDLELSLSAYIKILFFKISFSYHFKYRAQFSFGSDRKTPWELAENAPDPMSGQLLRKIVLSPDNAVGHIEISPVVVPFCSVTEAGSYCMAFPAFLTPGDFQAVLDLLFSLLCSDGEEHMTLGYAMSLQQDDVMEQIDDSFVYRLFAEHIRVNIGFSAEEGDKSDESAGIIFPMLPQLGLRMEDSASRQKVREVHFGERVVDTAYMQALSEYFEKLNADPGYAVKDLADGEEQIPLCGALMVDWVRMIVKELAGQAVRIVRDAGEDAEKKHTEKIPEIMIAHGMSLQKLSLQTKPQFDNADTGLWECISETYAMASDNIVIDMSRYVFDNSAADLSPEEAAALFFVRLYDADVLYTPYAEYILQKNERVDMLWRCSYSGEFRLQLRGNRYRSALAGDSVVRLAKECALLDGLCGEAEWMRFQRDFLSINHEKGRSYTLFGKYIPTAPAATLLELFCRYYPDFQNNPSDYPLWEAEILCPGKTFRLPGNSGAASKTEVSVRARVLSDDNAADIGALVSRAFLQGTRIPDPDTQEQKPMYEVAQQQIILPAEPNDYMLRLLCDTGDLWINVTTEEAPLPWERIQRMLPENRQEALEAAEDIPAFSEQAQCFTMADGWQLAGNGDSLYLGVLPQAASAYIAEWRTFPGMEKEDAAVGDIQWAYLANIRLYRKEKGVYYVLGVKGEEAGALYTVVSGLGADMPECRLYSRISRLKNGHNALMPVDADDCILIKTNLSKETHHMSCFALEDAGNAGYAADINNSAGFLKLLWECTVIGGGYWLCLNDDNLDEGLFDDEGYAELILAVSYNSAITIWEAVNAVYMPVAPVDVALYGDLEKVKCPVLPPGCEGITIRRKFDNEDRFQSLFQLLGYEASACESAPVMPQPGKEGYFQYQIIFPMWKMFRNAQEEERPYDGIGRECRLTLFLRDVLGNRRPVHIGAREDGSHTVQGRYNDILIGLHELLAVKWGYSFGTEKQTGAYLAVTGQTAVLSDADRDKAGKTILRAIQQLSCSDIVLSVRASLCSVTVPDTALHQALEYLHHVYAFISGEEESVSDFEIRCPIGMAEQDKNICPVSVWIVVERSVELCADEAAGRAQTLLAPLQEYHGKQFAENFAQAFPQYRPAYDGEGRPVGVLNRMLADYDGNPYAVAPFEIKTGEETIQSPEFYAPAPLAVSLRTMEIAGEGEAQAYTFADADVNKWEGRLLEDIEELLGGKMVCNAAVICPDKAERLVSAKNKLAEMLADRIMPVRKEAERQIPDDVRDAALERFRKDLRMAYGTDVIAAFEAFWTSRDSDSIYRLDPEMELDGCIAASKLEAAPVGDGRLFTLFLSETDTGLSAAKLSFPYLEYDIEPGIEGYEKSKWLRFAEPVTGQANLFSNLLAPYPKKTCPLPPQLLMQQYDTKGLDYPKYDWSCQIEANLCSQDTMRLMIEYNRPVSAGDNRIDVQTEILGRYQLERSGIMAMLGNAEQFETAYSKFVSYVEQYAQSARGKDMDTDMDTAGENAVCIELGFAFRENRVEISVLNEDDVSKELGSIGARLSVPETVDVEKADAPVLFEVRIEGLSVLEWNQITPKAQIVRNANLFHNSYVEVSDCFIFRTQAVELPSLLITVIYETPVERKVKSVSDGIAGVWDYLQMDRYSANLRMCVTVFYSYSVNEAYGSILAHTPVTFMADVGSGDELIQNIESWKKDIDIGCLSMDIVLYQKDSDRMLAHTYVRFWIDAES